MQQKPDFKSSFLAVMAEESPGGHPAAEALAAHRTEELDSEERQRVHQHLAGCLECAELARDMDLFTDPPGSVEAPDEFEVAAFVRALGATTSAPREWASSSRPQLESRPSAKASPWRRSLALAASLVLAFGASWWLSAELSRPRANVPIIDLVEDASQRTGRQTSPNKMRRDVGGLLNLTPDSAGDFASFEARILDSEDGPVHSFEDLVKDPDGDAFQVLMPPGSLAPGDYRLDVTGRTGDRSEVIASYRLRVLGPP